MIWDIVKEDSLTNAIFNLIPENEAGDEFVKYFQSKVIDNSRDKKEVLEKAVELANGRNLSPEEQNSLAEWWKEECQHSYGRKLRLTRIKTKKFGRIWVFLKGV